MKTVNPEDNPNHEDHERKKEAQRKRDQAEIDKRNAQNAQAAGEESNRDAVEREAKVGAGPAGLNTGASNTFDQNPRDRAQVGKPGYSGPVGGAAIPNTGGTGLAPPQGEQVTSDKPQFGRPVEDRAKANPDDPNAQAAAKQSDDERRQAQEREDQAKAKLESAGEKIGESQSKPAPEVDKGEKSNQGVG